MRVFPTRTNPGRSVPATGSTARFLPGDPAAPRKAEPIGAGAVYIRLYCPGVRPFVTGAGGYRPLNARRAEGEELGKGRRNRGGWARDRGAPGPQVPR